MKEKIKNIKEIRIEEKRKKRNIDGKRFGKRIEGNWKRNGNWEREGSGEDRKIEKRGWKKDLEWKNLDGWGKF